MTPASERQQFIDLIQEAVDSGAGVVKACEEAGITLRTYRRWWKGGQLQEDQRPLCSRPEPSNKLTEQECATILQVCNQPEYAGLPPTQIVPRLLDLCIYHASESSYYRVLRAADQQHRRGRSR